MNTTHKYERASDLPLALTEALLAWTLSLADTKLRLGVQFSNWVTGTPALEAAVGSAAITQDELGHARGLFTMLRAFPNAPEGLDANNDLEARTVYYAPPALNQPWPNWLDIVAATVILDRALQITLAATVDSSFAPLAGLSAKVIQEEAFHRTYGDTWFARMAQENEQIRNQLQRSVDWVYQLTDTWLGPAQQPTSEPLIEAGILTQTLAQVRGRWQQQVAALIEQNGLTLPAAATDWAGWDSRFRAMIT